MRGTLFAQIPRIKEFKSRHGRVPLVVFAERQEPSQLPAQEEVKASGGIEESQFSMAQPQAMSS